LRPRDVFFFAAAIWSSSFGWVLQANAAKDSPVPERFEPCQFESSSLRGVLRVVFQRRKPAAIGVKVPFPGFIEPALATSIEKVPSGERWIHEIKFDGYRVQVHLANEAIRIFTRRGHDWTKRFPKVANDAWHIKASSAIIDGEIVVPAADGTTDFSVLQNELKGRSSNIVLVAFDLLYLTGRDIRKEPLVRRKAELKKIIAGTDVQFSEALRSGEARCSRTPASSAWKAWCRRSATALMQAAGAITG
jgi:bifunctional non-homologous end joining protein LigD